MNYSKLFTEFCLWIESVEEDTPLPFECKILCFGLTKKGSIFFSASEFVPEKIVPCEFYPLEAQNFNFQSVFSFDVFEKMIKDFSKVYYQYVNINTICYNRQFENPIIINL